MRIVLLLACAAMLAGCGSGGEPAATQSPPAAGAPAPGGGLSIEEATASDLDEPLMVRGYVIERDGELRLCEAILESHPPQCGEPSLRIVANGVPVAPSEEPTSLLGEVEDGEIRLSATSS